MNNLIIIQARLSSTRLPGKVLQPICAEQSILDIQLNHLTKLKMPLVLATTINDSDQPLVEWALKNGVDYFCGDELNVLQRFIDCAKKYNGEKLIRICSDNPFIQLNSIGEFIDELDDGADYVSYADAEGTPAIRKHWGLFTEGVKLSALQKSQMILEEKSDAAFYQEHVTNFVYEHPGDFNVSLLPAPEVVIERGDLRFTIDTQNDFDNMKHLLHLLPLDEQTNLNDLIDTVNQKPEILAKMQLGIEQFDK